MHLTVDDEKKLTNSFNKIYIQFSCFMYSYTFECIACLDL